MMRSEKLWSRNFVLVIIINFLVFMNHIMLLSTFPFYIESLGGSEALAGLAATLLSFIAVLCRPFVGWMLDSGRRRACSTRLSARNPSRRLPPRARKANRRAVSARKRGTKPKRRAASRSGRKRRTGKQPQGT